MGKRLVLLAILYSLPIAVGEVTIRCQRGKLLFLGSFREQQLALLRSAYPAEYDAALGFVPRPGACGNENAWGTRVTIDEDGFRWHPPSTRRGGLILAVGDSFTFGDQVNDDETWPFLLERQIQSQVVNGGVFGYGFDQTVLRAERLVPRLRPGIVLVSLIDDDIDRCELSCRFAEKPYFSVASGELVLHNVPVPRTHDLVLKRWLGYSALADELGQRLAPRWWRLVGAGSVREHAHGLEVCQGLLKRLRRLGMEFNSKIMLVAQARPRPPHEGMQKFVKYARGLGLEVLDFHPLLWESLAADPTLVGKWFFRYADPQKNFLAEADGESGNLYDGHMRPQGNAWVAEHIAARLRKLGWLESSQ